MTNKDDNDRFIEGELTGPAQDTKPVVRTNEARKTSLRLVKEGVDPADLPLPSDVHAERALLSSMLWCGLYAPTTVTPATVRDLVSDPEIWFSPAHRAIWTALLGVFDEGKPIELAHVFSNLVAAGASSMSGGMEYLEQLVGHATPTSEPRARSLADNIRLAWLRRSYIAVAREIEASAKTAPTLEAVAEVAHTSLMKVVADSSVSSGLISMHQAAERAFRQMMAPKPAFLRTGLRDLDDLILGLFDNEVTILAARTSHGKSSLAIQIATNAVESDPSAWVLYVSLEMPSERFVTRMVASAADVNMKRIVARTASMDETARMTTATSALYGKRVYFSVERTQSILNIDALATKLNSELATKKEPGRVRLIVVDHLGLVKPTREAMAKKSGERELAETSRGLGWLGERHGCAILALAQINRKSEEQAEKDKMPRLHHIGGSGAIEQDARRVLILHREKDRYNRWIEDKPARVAVAKNSEGETGLVFLKCEPSVMRFSNWDGGYYPRPGDDQ